LAFSLYVYTRGGVELHQYVTLIITLFSAVDIDLI